MTMGQALYIPHGGGPLPLLNDVGHLELSAFLKELPGRIHTPEAIVIVSAHWETEEISITSGPNPALIYDYYGFPDETYEIRYPAPGDTGLAQQIHGYLNDAGINSRLDEHRGYDHGVFVPLKLMYPDASIPCVQVSLHASLDPALHVQIGKALSALRTQNILLLGSGFSFHNMRAFSFSADDIPDDKNDEFQKWLVDTCTDKTSDDDSRNQRLEDWATAPNARYCHPREEHLLPLHVCAGASSGAAELIFSGQVLAKRTCALLWP